MMQYWLTKNPDNIEEALENMFFDNPDFQICFF
jgi:hypothetical protein